VNGDCWGGSNVTRSVAVRNKDIAQALSSHICDVLGDLGVVARVTWADAAGGDGGLLIHHDHSWLIVHLTAAKNLEIEILGTLEDMHVTQSVSAPHGNV
jgi:hypothetical protein